MRPVDQQVLHDPDGLDIGDCFRACLASILERDDVPHFVALHGPEQAGAGPLWWAEARRWVRAELGIDLASFNITDEIPTPRSIYVDEPGGWQQFGIGAVPSPRGPFTHAVVVDMAGTVVHDPHPSRASVGASIIAVDLLVDIDDEWNPLIQTGASS